MPPTLPAMRQKLGALAAEILTERWSSSQTLTVSRKAGLKLRANLQATRGFTAETFGSYLELHEDSDGWALTTVLGKPGDNKKAGFWLFLDEKGEVIRRPSAAQVEDFALLLSWDAMYSLKRTWRDDRPTLATRRGKLVVNHSKMLPSGRAKRTRTFLVTPRGIDN